MNPYSFLGSAFVVVSWRRRATNRSMPEVRQVVIRHACAATLLDFVRELRTTAWADWLAMALYELRDVGYHAKAEWTWVRPPAVPRRRRRERSAAE